jgi:dTDP-3-amino-3,4,6-trideoxy-alpha-D-glucose transaminase
VSGVRIPLFDMNAQLAELRPEIERRMSEVIESGRFIGGPEVEAFEHEFAAYLGVEHVIGVGNGTDALTIALLSLGIGPGDDVVVPSFTFYASAEAIPHTGARPVFCDIDPETFCVTRETVEAALTPATRAIVPVHLFGLPAPVDELRPLAEERGVAIVEDAAQAPGAILDGKRVGSLGDAATFSFFPSKNLFCLGDGGAVATNDAAVAEQVRLLRFHGSRDKSTFTKIGFNSRLDALQAAVLRVVLGRLDELNARRRELVAAYLEEGLGEYVSLPRLADRAEPVHHMLVTKAEDPAALRAALGGAGIESRSYYEVPIHRQPAMAAYRPAVELSGTERAGAMNLAVPMGPTYTAETARSVVSELEAACTAFGAGSAALVAGSKP